MNHRERMRTALAHEEPDRVPIDLGATLETMIGAVVYRQLRLHLGLEAGLPRVIDVQQQVSLVEEDVLQLLGGDALPVVYEPKAWRRGFLSDGSPAELPAKFLPEVQDDGSQVVFDEAGNQVLLMPQDGLYFDSIYSPLASAMSVRDIEQHMQAIETYDKPSYLDMSHAELGQRAKALRENTDYLLVAYFGGHIFQASQSLRGWDTFLVDLLAEKKLAEALMDNLLQANLRRFDLFAQTIAPHVDVVLFEDDLGMQDRLLVSPELYRDMIKPYHHQLYRFARSRCDAYLMLHTDGAVSPLIPDFIEMGIDILNPVQVSAKGMESHVLKDKFGQDIVFWGGGCDSQSTLPFGTPEDVSDEVKRRIDDLAPGGGFVFSTIHNVQNDTPPGNIVAMFQTALEYGVS